MSLPLFFALYCLEAGLFFIIVLLALFVFLFLIPNRRRQRAAREQIRSIAVGDEVLTVGGLIGRVVEADDSELRVEIAEGVIVRIARRGVATVLHPEEPEGAEVDGVEEVEEEEPLEPEPPSAR